MVYFHLHILTECHLQVFNLIIKNGNLWYRCEILYIIEITEINDLTVRVTVLVQEKDRDALASLVTRTEKESFLQSEVRRYLHAP